MSETQQGWPTATLGPHAATPRAPLVPAAKDTAEECALMSVNVKSFRPRAPREEEASPTDGSIPLGLRHQGCPHRTAGPPFIPGIAGWGLALGVSAPPRPRDRRPQQLLAPVSATDYSPRASCRGASSERLMCVQAKNPEPFKKKKKQQAF